MMDKHQNRPPRAVENYETAFYVSATCLLFMILWLLAALGGFGLAASVAFCLYACIGILGRGRV